MSTILGNIDQSVYLIHVILILTINLFKLSGKRESCLRNLLKFLQSDADLLNYPPSVQSGIIADALPIGIAAVLNV